MTTLASLFLKYGPQVVASGIIMAVRYFEKKSLIKHYKKKFERLKEEVKS